MQATIELSFSTDTARELLPELRDELRREIPGIDFSLKEPAVLPGRMGVAWAEMFMHAAVISTSEVMLLSLLEPGMEGIAHKIKAVRDKFMRDKNLQKLDISGSVKAGDKRSSFKIAGDKEPQYFNDQPYSIDPDHTHVLLVGCGTYADNEISDIPPVEQNLRSLYELIIDKQYFGIPAENVVVSLDDSNHVIKKLLHQVSRRDGIETLFFYYVGHGFCSGSDDYYLAASNTEKDGDFINSGIEKDFIKDKILSQSPAKQKIAIVDACYSGYLTQSGATELFEREVKGSYVLTSSTADEVSFYDKSQPYTFFTGALLHTLRDGLKNESETLSLADLYTETVAEMKKRKLQQPTYKNGLNIAPGNFIISHNAAFSPEYELGRPDLLASKGMYKEAQYEYQRLLAKYPDNKELQAKALQFNNERMYSDFVNEGDRYFFQLKDYRNAADCYQKALGLRQDVALRDKLLQCQNLMRGSSGGQGDGPHIEPVPVPKPVPQPVPPVDPPVKKEAKNPWYKRIALLLAVFGAVAIGYWVENRDKEKTAEHDAFTSTSDTANRLYENSGGGTPEQNAKSYLSSTAWTLTTKWGTTGGGTFDLQFSPNGDLFSGDSLMHKYSKAWLLGDGKLTLRFDESGTSYYFQLSTSDDLSTRPSKVSGTGVNSEGANCTWEMVRR